MAQCAQTQREGVELLDYLSRRRLERLATRFTGSISNSANTVKLGLDFTTAY